MGTEHGQGIKDSQGPLKQKTLETSSNWRIQDVSDHFMGDIIIQPNVARAPRTLLVYLKTY